MNEPESRSSGATRRQRAALIAALIVLFGVCASPLVSWSHAGGGYARWALIPRHTILIACIPYAASLALMRRIGLSRRAVLLTGTAMGAVLFVPPTTGSHDIYSYLAYAKLLAHRHLDPLVTQPVAFGHDPWLRFVLWRHTPSVYGPLWTYATAALAALTGFRLGLTLYLVKALSLAGVGVAAVLAPRMISRDDRERDFVRAAIVWNPLILFAVAGEGHVDGALLGLLIAALFFRSRERNALVSALLVAASLVKIYVVVLLLLHVVDLVRKRDVRGVLTAGAASLAGIATYAPLWRGAQTFTALRVVAGRFTPTLPNAFRDLLEDGFSSHGMSEASANVVGVDAARVAGAVVLAGVLIYLIMRRRDAPAGWRWTMAFGAYVVTSPWFLPWHAIPLVGLGLAAPDLRGGGALRRAALAVTATSVVGIAVIRFGVPLIALAIRGRKRSSFVNDGSFATVP